jgi:hypothetical protein
MFLWKLWWPLVELYSFDDISHCSYISYLLSYIPFHHFWLMIIVCDWTLLFYSFVCFGVYIYPVYGHLLPDSPWLTSVLLLPCSTLATSVKISYLYWISWVCLHTHMMTRPRCRFEISFTGTEDPSSWRPTLSALWRDPSYRVSRSSPCLSVECLTPPPWCPQTSRRCLDGLAVELSRLMPTDQIDRWPPAPSFPLFVPG